MQNLKSLTSRPDRAEPWHDRRYELTLATLLQMGLKAESTVLSFGGASIFDDVLREEVGCSVSNTWWDLRTHHGRLSPYNQFDFVLLMEVVEHLSDEPNPERVADWTYSGVRNCLATAREFGSKLFLSTPNICGLKSIINVIERKHPHTFQPHTHEYAPNEIADLVFQAGWTIDELKTVNSWNHHSLQEQKKRLALKLLSVAGAPTDLRNDNIFILAH